MPVRFQVDGDFYDHPKVLSMSDAAFALWVRAGSYCAAKGTDGFVADDVLSLFSETQRNAAQELVQRRLWKRVKGGYQFHQYGQRNLLKARVEADREYDRDRKQRQRKQARQTENPQVDTENVPPGHRPDIRPDSERSPNRSVSVSVSESVSVSGSGQAPTSADGGLDGASPAPPDRCPKHLDDPDPPSCGPCRGARINRERWERTEHERQEAARNYVDRDTPKCRRHQGQPAHNCAGCAGERKGIE